jgi:hypothetical protein
MNGPRSAYTEEVTTNIDTDSAMLTAVAAQSNTRMIFYRLVVGWTSVFSALSSGGTSHVRSSINCLSDSVSRIISESQQDTKPNS